MATARRPYGFFGKPLFASAVVSVQVLPPSVERNSPLADGAVGLSPIETLLRVHDSPVPTQTFFEFFGSSAIAPIDCTGCSSNTGRYRVPLSSDFQTPPLAAPTKSVILPDSSRVPASAEMRPLIVAEAMLRVPRPEMVTELNGASSAQQEIMQRSRNESDAGTRRTPKVSRAKGASSRGFGSSNVLIY